MNTESREPAVKSIGPRAFLIVMLALSAAAGTVIGCAWPGTSHSVRFNYYQTEREMGRLPPLPTMANGLNAKRAWWDWESGDGDWYSKSEKASKAIKELWERAEVAERDRNLRLDRELLSEYLKQTGLPRAPYFSYAEKVGDRNSAVDRMDALSALDNGASEAAVSAYLDARRLHDSKNPDINEIQVKLDIAQADRNLKDNVLYLQAAELWRQNDFAPAAAVFKSLADRYRNSEKREAALFMTAVATMKTSATFISASGNADYNASNSTSVAADQAWFDAFSAFQKVVDQYPQGRYYNDARGWQAYLYLRRNDRAAALIQYYRLLADSSENARTEAAFSLSLIRSSASEDEIARVEKELANEPQAALAYAYHNVYNYAIDPSDDSPPYESVKDYKGNYDERATRERNADLKKEWQSDRNNIAQSELTRTLQFSKRLMDRYPNLTLGGAFALRAAQASEELDDNVSAESFAQHALKSQLTAEQRAEALWTAGVAQQRRRHFADATRSFQALVHDYPGSNLIEGARRELAIIAEDAGDLNAALEQYIALDYAIDVAYLIDVLMTPEQLAAFIQTHANSPKKNEMTYALGLRYLRLNRWQEARQTLTLVKVQGSPGGSIYSMGWNCSSEKRHDCLDPKDGDTGEDGGPIITARLVLRDVQTANDLEALENAVVTAKGDEATAEAMYQLASYQYEARTLLFYNPIAWKQVLNGRYWNLGQLAASGDYRAKNESQILFDHMQQHDPVARALKTYLEIAAKFPRTRAARDALYTAAVCHDRLSNYNPYWRDIYENGLHAGNRMVTYADVKSAYPHYQLPRGTSGWQPSTRTVNNGPGWAAPPPPPPKPKRLNRTERVKLYAGILRDHLTTFWQQNGKRWLTEILTGLGLIFTFRLAKRNQRRLRARLARRRIQQARQVVTYPWFDWFWIDPVVPSRRERIRRLLTDKRQELIDLAHDRRSRPMLLRSIVSHSLCIALSVALVWTICFG